MSEDCTGLLMILKVVEVLEDFEALWRIRMILMMLYICLISRIYRCVMILEGLKDVGRFRGCQRM